MPFRAACSWVTFPPRRATRGGRTRAIRSACSRGSASRARPYAEVTSGSVSSAGSRSSQVRTGSSPRRRSMRASGSVYGPLVS